MAWSVGELAVAITENWWNTEGLPAIGPHKGQILKIAGIRPFGDKGILYFRFKEFPTRGYRSDCFRKLVNDEAKGSKKKWNKLLDKHKQKEPEYA